LQMSWFQEDFLSIYLVHLHESPANFP
jgi:hypothetical protein